MYFFSLSFFVAVHVTEFYVIINIATNLMRKKKPQKMEKEAKRKMSIDILT